MQQAGGSWTESKKICKKDHNHVIKEIISGEGLEDPDCEATKKEHGRQIK